MELDVTRFFTEAAPMDYSASRAEIGDNAGPDTWRAACEDAEEYSILPDDDAREAFRNFVRSSGGWTSDEIAAWSDQELNALCMQWVAGDMREGNLDTGNPDWEKYEKLAQRGTIAGNLYRGDNGRVYFYIGN